MNKYVLSGILYCGNCGSKMIGVCEGKKGNWTGYRCKTKARNGINSCNMRNVNAFRIEDAVFKDIMRLFLVPQNVRIIFQELKEILDRTELEIQNELNDVESEIMRTEESINRYMEGFEKGFLEPKYFSERNKVMINEKEKYERKKKILLIKIEDMKYDKVYFYQLKKYLYNVKLSTENKILDDSNVKRIILQMLIKGGILKNIMILSPRMAKVKYNIGNDITEKLINHKSRIRSGNIDTSVKHAI